MLRVTEGGDPLLGRAMAIYRIERHHGRVAIEIVYRVIGRGTALLSRVDPGRTLWLLGPLGRPFPDPPEAARPLLVGGGTGIASLHLLARHLLDGPRGRPKPRRDPLTVLVGARTKREVLCRADFAGLGARVLVATDDGTQGKRGFVTGLLEETLAGQARHGCRAGIVYACGPTPMMEAVWRICEGAGIPCRVSLEGPMACGFGVCLGCAVPCRPDDPGAPERSPRDRFKLVCTDGPVFDASTLAWGWDREEPAAARGSRGERSP
jgi:dihydroorotate dehydrogenase electron transfer subunit